MAAVNMEDERFGQVESDKQQAMTELEQTYSGMIGEADQYYQAQIDASKQWADTQSQLQQEQTDFTIEQIEQQKQQAAKDYTKEQSGAYVDWKKQSNQYGVAAEQQAAAGLAGTGFSESSQVSMYNTYQNRVATARESYNQAVLNYNNSIKEARLQNNSVLAEIAYQALQTQLELSLEGFQYKNQLILEQANKKVEMDNIYYNRYQDVLNQINTENAMAEEIRQFNANYELQTKQLEESIRQFELEYDQRIKEFDEGIRQFNVEIERLKKKDQQEYELQIKSLQQQAAALAEEKRQFNLSYELQKQQFEAQQAQIEQEKQAAVEAAKTKARQTASVRYTSEETESALEAQRQQNGKSYVATEYYNGPMNGDAWKYGTVAGSYYQPAGISGHGTLKKSGDKYKFTTTTLSGEKRTVTQNIWRAQDGTMWYWEGRQNKYIQVKGNSKTGYRSTGIGWKTTI